MNEIALILPTKRNTRIEIYRSNDGWRWRDVARNGRIVADSGESYTRKWSAKRAARKAAR